MKVLHINTHIYGGAAIAMLKLHEALLKKGVQSKVLILSGDSTQHENIYNYPVSEDSLLIKASRSLGLNWKKSDRNQYKVTRFQNNEYETFTFANTDYFVEDHILVKESDVINLHWVSNFINFPSFFRKVKKPIVWYLHDMNPFMGGFHYSIDRDNIIDKSIVELDQKQLALKKKALARSSLKYIVGDSRWITKCAKESKIYPKYINFATINYSINNEVYYPISKEAARGCLNIKKELFVIGFGASDLSNRRKGLHLLVDAINKLNKKEILLVLFGEGQPSSLQELNIPYLSLGKLNSPYWQRITYSALDLFVIPSLQEAFGQTCLEAMSCGTPVVGFSSSGIEDMIIPHKTGLLAKANDSTDLSRQIEFMMNNTDKRKEMGKSAVQFISDKFNEDYQSYQFMKIYEQVL